MAKLKIELNEDEIVLAIADYIAKTYPFAKPDTVILMQKYNSSFYASVKCDVEEGDSE